MNKLTLYNKTSVFIFSLFLTGFGGAVMVGYNLRKIGKYNLAVPLALLTLLGNAIVYQMAKNIFTGIYVLLITNLICGLILVSFVWDKYLGEVIAYNKKKIVWPLIAVVIFYGGSILLGIFSRN